MLEGLDSDYPIEEGLLNLNHSNFKIFLSWTFDVIQGELSADTYLDAKGNQGLKIGTVGKINVGNNTSFLLDCCREKYLVESEASVAAK